MTGTTSPSPVPPSVDLDAQASDWLARQEFGQLDEADMARFERWLAQSFHHRTAYWRMKALWQDSERLAALRSPMRQPHALIAKSRKWPKLAAVFALASMVGAGAWLATLDQPRSYATTLGERKTITLSDGSQIDLNTKSALRLGSSQREAWLDTGEAYFQIAHDASRPFVVHVAGHRVLDLGTKFLVRKEASKLEVSLVEGRAQIDAANPNGHERPAILTPGDVAIATADTLSVTRKAAPALADALGWRRGVLIFHYVPLADAVATFNRYNREQLVITDPSVGRVTVLGTFPVNDVAAFARVAKEVFGLNVARRNNDILISR
jgi:transmembrane sensor